MFSIPKQRRKSARFSTDEANRKKKILKLLGKMYPDASCALAHETPLQLLISTILSAQCTDERVNQVTPALFKNYPTAEKLAKADLRDLEALIKSTGFFRNKAKSIKGACEKIVELHAHQVPESMEDLVALPGVGRKTANVVLGNAFGKNEGVVVDTHVARLSQRLGFTKHKDPIKIEQDLMEVVPRTHWTIWSHWLISHGRKTCKAIKPRCGSCDIAQYCPSRMT